MENIQNYIVGLMPKYDKLMHFFIGTLLYIFLNFIFESIISLIIVIIIALLKELHDKFIKKSFFSLLDFIYTIITALLLTIF